MMKPEFGISARCEVFRGYLTLLAAANIGPGLRGKLDPADLVQQALLKACQGHAAFRGEGQAQLRAWLRAILANVIRDGLRKFRSASGQERSLEAMLEESSRRLEGILRDGGSSPSQKAVRNENVLLLADALARLPDDQRQAVELRHLRAESLERIAERMGKSIPAVSGLIRRGLATLRSGLATVDQE